MTKLYKWTENSNKPLRKEDTIVEYEIDLIDDLTIILKIQYSYIKKKNTFRKIICHITFGKWSDLPRKRIETPFIKNKKSVLK